MKIVEINMLHNGSTGKIMLGIADCARENGHEVWSFSPRNYVRGGKENEPEISGHAYFGTAFENMIHLRFAQLTGFQGYLSVFGTQELLKHLNSIQPDIVHLHNLHNCSINIPMLFRYLKKNKIRTVWTLHDCWAFTGQCPHFTLVKCENWKSCCHDCPQIHIYPKAYVDRTKIMWKMKRGWFTGIERLTLVSPSRWLSGLIKQSFLQQYPVKVINNGIDLSIFHNCISKKREEWDKTCGKKYYVLGVAFDWGKRKGLDIFVELNNRLPYEYQIVLVGTNERIDAHIPHDIISIHQTHDQQELAEIYSAADVFFNPTREDNYPTVNMESLACGTPVITFNTGGSPEIIDDSCGIVIPVDDIEKSIEAIRSVCEWKSITRAECIEKAKKFDMNSRFKEYVELFETC